MLAEVATVNGSDAVVLVNALLNTLQVCFLAYLAAKYRTNGK